MKTTVYIDGMHCKSCMAKVEKSLSTVEGVQSAKVNLDKGFAVLKTKDPVNHDVILDTIHTLGYEVKEIK